MYTGTNPLTPQQRAENDAIAKQIRELIEGFHYSDVDEYNGILVAGVADQKGFGAVLGNGEAIKNSLITSFIKDPSAAQLVGEAVTVFSKAQNSPLGRMILGVADRMIQRANASQQQKAAPQTQQAAADTCERKIRMEEVSEPVPSETVQKIREELQRMGINPDHCVIVKM